MTHTWQPPPPNDGERSVVVVIAISKAPVLNQAPHPLAPLNRDLREAGVEDLIAHLAVAAAEEEEDCMSQEESKGEIRPPSVIPLALPLRI